MTEVSSRITEEGYVVVEYRGSELHLVGAEVEALRDQLEQHLEDDDRAFAATGRNLLL